MRLKTLRSPGLSAPKTAILLMGLVLLAGQAHAGVGDYFADRWFDFTDLFAVRVSAAKGAKSAGAMVRATTLAQAGMVWFNGQHVGMDRRAVGIWREKRFHWALGPLAWNEIEMRTQKGNSYAQEFTPWTEAAERGIVRNGLYYDDGRGDVLAVGVELQPGILPGFELRVNPLQALDFIVGWTTLDVFDDDAPDAADPTPESLPEDEMEHVDVLDHAVELEHAIELDRANPTESPTIELPAAPIPQEPGTPSPGDVPLNR